MSKTAPKHFFSKNASVNLPRTRFDMSSTNTTTLTTDYLYPVFSTAGTEESNVICGIV